MNREIIFLALLACLLSGCASIVSDNSYPVSIGSAPKGASFTISNRDGVEIHAGITPATST